MPRFAGTKFGGGGTPVVVPRWLDTTGQNFLGKKFPCLQAGRDFIQDKSRAEVKSLSTANFPETLNLKLKTYIKKHSNALERRK